MNSTYGPSGFQPEFSAYVHRPAADEPGTLLEQFQVIATYLEIAPYWSDQEAAKQAARKAVLKHARYTATVTEDVRSPRRDRF